MNLGKVLTTSQWIFGESIEPEAERAAGLLCLRRRKCAWCWRNDSRSVCLYLDDGKSTLSRTARLEPDRTGACLDNAVAERFFGRLMHEWLLNIVHLTRESMEQDVQKTSVITTMKGYIQRLLI